MAQLVGALVCNPVGWCRVRVRIRSRSYNRNIKIRVGVNCHLPTYIYIYIYIYIIFLNFFVSANRNRNTCCDIAVTASGINRNAHAQNKTFEPVTVQTVLIDARRTIDVIEILWKMR